MTDIPHIPDADPPIPDLDIDHELLLETILDDFSDSYGEGWSEELATAYRKLFKQSIDHPILARKLWDIWKDKIQ